MLSSNGCEQQWAMKRVRGNKTRAAYTILPTTSIITLEARLRRPSRPHLTFRMANRGYDVVVDVDTEVNNVATANIDTR